MDSEERINDGVLALFAQWKQEVGVKNPQLFSGAFSNIFCPGVTNDWVQSTMRMMVIGEEATWSSRDRYNYHKDAELRTCQRWIIDEMNGQLTGTQKPHKSPFWRRIRAMKKAFPDAAFFWANMDCINTSAGKALSSPDRKALHDCNTQLARQLVDIINPTHIIFFGWHDISLQHEFPDLCGVVYPHKFGDTGYMKENRYLLRTKYQGKTVVFTYHPSWLRANSDDYIQRINKLLLE